MFFHCGHCFHSHFYIPVVLGKIAIDELMRMCDTQRQDINKQTVWKDNESLRLTLQTLWKV